MALTTESTEIRGVEREIHLHPAWQGHISGLQAEDVLKGHAPYVYLLRQGELPSNYYVSFVLPDHSIKHQPFVIKITAEGWFCRNGYGSGPFLNTPFQEVLHSIMHCNREDSKPLCDETRVAE